MKCEVCNVYETIKLTSFHNHLMKGHKIKPKIYYDTFYTSSGCIVCERETQFVNCFTGYKKLCSSKKCMGEYKRKSNNYPKIHSEGYFIKKADRLEVCPICFKEFYTSNSISSHFQHNHKDFKLSNESLTKTIYDLFKKVDGEDECLECERKLKFGSYYGGYSGNFCSISCCRVHELKSGLEISRGGRWKFKKYKFPSGKIVNIQGFEPQCIDYLLSKGIDEKNILICGRGFPIVDYYYDGKPKKYFPDIFIDNLNLIIEVKCAGTYIEDLEINLIKRQSSLDAGYDFEFVIDHDFSVLKKYNIC